MQPRREPKGTIIIKELDEFLEIIFIVEGRFKVGYTLNG